MITVTSEFFEMGRSCERGFSQPNGERWKINKCWLLILIGVYYVDIDRSTELQKVQRRVRGNG